MTKERVWAFRDGGNEGATVLLPRSGCHAVAQGYGMVPAASQLRFVNWLEVLLEVARLTAESQCQPSSQLAFPLQLSYPGLGEGLSPNTFSPLQSGRLLAWAYCVGSTRVSNGLSLQNAHWFL